MGTPHTNWYNWITKDCAGHDLSHGSLFDIPITKDLLESVKLGKQRHNHHPENTRKFIEAKAEKLQKMTNKKKKLKKKCNKSFKNFILKFRNSQMA